jgi:hypothetical protein
MTHDTMDLSILEPNANHGYLPRPIPAQRDNEIAALLSQVLAQDRLAQLAQQLVEGHAVVLRVFAERMATAAVRNDDLALLRLGTIGLLLSWRGPDNRETLLVFPVLLDAIRRIGADVGAFVTSIRQTVGDQLASPFIEFLQRSERDKSLQAMGYITATDQEGFRYLRKW